MTGSCGAPVCSPSVQLAVIECIIQHSKWGKAKVAGGQTQGLGHRDRLWSPSVCPRWWFLAWLRQGQFVQEKRSWWEALLATTSCGWRQRRDAVRVDGAVISAWRQPRERGAQEIGVQSGTEQESRTPHSDDASDDIRICTLVIWDWGRLLVTS